VVHEKNFGSTPASVKVIFLSLYRFFLEAFPRRDYNEIMEPSTADQLTEDVPATEVEQRTKLLLHTLVGEFLAKGRTNGEILEYLQEEQELSAEGAQAVLRGVYDSWSSVRAGLNLQAEDDRNWHSFLRMRLLQSAMTDPSTPSQNLALRVLDSLATLQGITTVQVQPVPLSIELVEKAPEPEVKPEKAKDTGET